MLKILKNNKLKIETGRENPVLRAVSLPVKSFDKKLGKLIKDMTKTMIAEKGVGLAAPQIGLNQRLIVVSLFGGKERKYIPMINPEILELSDEVVVKEEGCLSLPEEFMDVERAKSVKIAFSDIKGREQTLLLNNMDARVVQHEIDHLDGVLFVDRIK